MTGEEMRALVSEAGLAPSVHNVQPARWRIAGDRLLLLEDLRCRLTIGDPRANDAGISLGAAAEGLRLAASRIGRRIEPDTAPLPPATPSLAPVAWVRVGGAGEIDPLAALVDARRSWRSAFEPAAAEDRIAAAALSNESAAVITDAEPLRQLAQTFDAASYGFMRDDAFRRELVSWMRLSRRHPRWSRDGLNADAMAMSAIEATGARIVLGPAFMVLDRVGVAAGLLAEGRKVAGAAGLVVLHRPKDESPFESGRHFYRLWLRIEAAGFGAAVLAALADDPTAAQKVAAMAGIAPDRRIVTAFRIGRRPDGQTAPRARRPLEEIVVSA